MIIGEIKKALSESELLQLIFDSCQIVSPVLPDYCHVGVVFNRLHNVKILFYYNSYPVVLFNDFNSI